MSSGLEVWTINTAGGRGDGVTFALFYGVLGQEFWDNSFRNYTVHAGRRRSIRFVASNNSSARRRNSI